MPLLRGRESACGSLATAAILSGVPGRREIARLAGEPGPPAKMLTDETLAVSDQHHQGDTRRSRGGESPADAARRAHPASGGGALQLAADGSARAAESRTDHP